MSTDLRFDGDALDLGRWLPHYLPAWSSRAATAASYRLEDGVLVLDVPVDHDAAGQSTYGNQQSLNARVIESPVEAIELG